MRAPVLQPVVLVVAVVVVWGFVYTWLPFRRRDK